MAAAPDDDARRTLAELEAKLRELERELLRGYEPEGIEADPFAAPQEPMVEHAPEPAAFPSAADEPAAAAPPENAAFPSAADEPEPAPSPEPGAFPSAADEPEPAARAGAAAFPSGGDGA